MLSWNEKILLIEISSRVSEDKDYRVSNTAISSFLGTSAATVGKLIASLIAKGCLIETMNEGSKRYVNVPSCGREIQINNVEPIEEEKKSEDTADEEAFIDRIYSLYPTRCPKRGTSLGKTHKDKVRIRTLLKRYTREQIERVINLEVKNKYGKQYMMNFCTFLNNFPDPDAISEDCGQGMELGQIMRSDEEERNKKYKESMKDLW